jgi:hypothetical protein
MKLNWHYYLTGISFWIIILIISYIVYFYKKYIYYIKKESNYELLKKIIEIFVLY